MTEARIPRRRVLANTAGPQHDPVTLARMARAKEDVTVQRILDEENIRRRLPWWKRALLWIRLTFGLLVPARRSR